MKITSHNRKRYRLHSLAKKQGFKVLARKHTVFINVPPPDVDKWTRRLVNEFHYSLQTELTF